MDRPPDPPVRLLEILASLSLAIDLGMGAPHAWVMRSSLVARHLAERAGLDPTDQSHAMYVTLLRHLGCTSTAEIEARWLGNERSAHEILPWLMDPTDLRMVARALSADTLPTRWSRLVQVVRTLRGAAALPFEDLTRDHCQVAERAARSWSLAPEVEAGLFQSYERWDGNGHPSGLKGSALLPAARLAALSLDIVRFADLGGLETAIHVVRHRRGTFHDPQLADLFLEDPDQLRPLLDRAGSTIDLLEAEPHPHRNVAERDLDASLETLAEMVDAQTSDRHGWSRRLADLVVRAAPLVLPPDEGILVRRAALVQGLGRLTVESSIWSLARPFRPSERERVRLVPYHTERILSASPALAPLGALASASFERLDGSGYPKGTRGQFLSRGSKLLAVATVHQALTSDRPHRRALSAEAARTVLEEEVSRGRLDADCVSVVLGVASGSGRRARVQLPFELAPRELDVLRLIAQGMSNKDMALRLKLSPRTVGHHVERLYAKIHVRTRAEATRFALENSLAKFR